MGLHDRLKTSNGVGGLATAELLTNGSTQEPSGPTVTQDPYAELKTRIHHACIATLGAELFKREGTGDLNERVTRAVTEQLVLDRTPLTREERQQVEDLVNARVRANLPAQTEVLGALNETVGPNATIVQAAGSMPGDLQMLWRAEDPKQ